MDQSLSGGSGAPLRMTLTLICSFRGSSDMREIIACADLSNGNPPSGIKLKKRGAYDSLTPATSHKRSGHETVGNSITESEILTT